MLYGILAGNIVHPSESARSLKEDYAVIVIDYSDIAKPESRKMEALSEIRDGSTGEITQGYFTIEAAVLSETGKVRPIRQKRSAGIVLRRKGSMSPRRSTLRFGRC